MTRPEQILLERLETPDAGDLAAINALESDSFSNPWTPEALASMLQSTVTRLYVARELTGTIVGFCACWIVADELHINTFSIE